MLNKIGFSLENELKENEKEITEVNKLKVVTPKKSVVRVFFPHRNFACSYYNDMFDLKLGDLVFVEGKLAGKIGRVVEINYNFKIKLSDYMRVISAADTEMHGECYLADSYVVTNDKKVLSFDKVKSWYTPLVDPEEEEETVSSCDGSIINIDNLQDLNINKEVASNGFDAFRENAVLFFEIDNGNGKAIVNTSEPHFLEFEYNNREIKNLVCDCYDVGICEHELAFLLQLKETLDLVQKEYGFTEEKYIVSVERDEFIKFVLNSKNTGKLSF